MSDTIDDSAATDADAIPAPTRNWARRRTRTYETPLAVHWIDEHGSVVRLLTSTAEPAIDSATDAAVDRH